MADRNFRALLLVLGVAVLSLIFYVSTKDTDADKYAGPTHPSLAGTSPRPRTTMVARPLWQPMAPAPLSNAYPGYTHVTAYEQQVAASIRIPEAHVAKCVNDAFTVGWQPGNFAAAVNEHKRFAAARPQRLETALVTPIGREWEQFAPHFQSCSSLRRYGEPSDGGKWVCALDTLRAPCIIYSLGSNRQVDFEDEMVRNTVCDIFTFDCSVAADQMPPVDPRVKFYPICLGTTTADKRFMSLPDVMSMLGHTSIELLKMDIEGGEYPVIDSLFALAQKNWDRSYSFLPRQIAFELHIHEPKDNAPVVFANQDALLQKLLLLGYVGVSRESNAACEMCAEYVFIRLPAACWVVPPVATPLDAGARASAHVIAL